MAIRGQNIYKGQSSLHVTCGLTRARQNERVEIGFAIANRAASNFYERDLSGIAAVAFKEGRTDPEEHRGLPGVEKSTFQDLAPK